MIAMRILVATAVAQEQEALQRGLERYYQESDSFNPGIDIEVVGVGPAQAAACTAKILAENRMKCAEEDRYTFVISAGIAGGFAEHIREGEVAIASEIVAVDLGVETADGFQFVNELGFGSARMATDQHIVATIAERLERHALSAIVGPIGTVSTATGTQETADERRRRVPGVVAEAMEGYGVAVAAQSFNLPVLEIRSISNRVGPRDRSAWKMKEAFAALEQIGFILPEVFV